MNVFILTFTGMEVAVGVLICTLAVLLFAIAYKKLLAYWGAKTKTKQHFCTLYNVEEQPAQGEIQLYFTAQEKKEVKIHLLTQDYEFFREIYCDICRLSGNIVHLDTKQLKNGVYFYCLITDNQKTMKKLIVFNAGNQDQ